MEGQAAVMKRYMAIIILIFLSIMLGGCERLGIGSPTLGDSIGQDLKQTAKIVFVNSKENALRFTVSDPNVTAEVAALIGESKPVTENPGVDSDYVITLYIQGGKEMNFDYWMGAGENGRAVNLRDGQGVYFRAPEMIDTYILNSTKMTLRPNFFVDLYSSTLSKCIALLDKGDSKGSIPVGVDVKSDRRMRRYTMSYEDERIFDAIEADGFEIMPVSEGGKYTYTVTYLTSIYNPDKVKIAVDVVKTADMTKQTFTVDGVLRNQRVWELTIGINNSK
jgi:hypothetical protein